MRAASPHFAQVMEDPETYLDRILTQDPNDPLGPGETEKSVRESMGFSMLATVDPDYEPNCGPAKVAARLFTSEDVLPAKDETVTVSARTLDKTAHRYRMTSFVVAVHVRRHRKMAPH